MDELKTSKIWNSKWPAVILMLVGACFMGYGIFPRRAGGGVYKSH